MTRTLSMIIVAAIAAITIAGCGSGDDDDAPPVTPRPVFEPSPVPTLVDPGSLILTPTTGDQGYTLDLPPGWDTAPTQVGGEDVFNLMDGDRIVAQITALCEPPLMAEGRIIEPIEYTNRDIVYVEQLRGQHDAPQLFLIRDEIAASSLRYVTSIGPVTVRQKVVHFTFDACHWTVRLRIYAPGQEQDFLNFETLFDRVVQSFTPA